MSQIDPNVRIELFDRFDFLVFEEGTSHALVRQWPTMSDVRWNIGRPPEWIGQCLGKIAEEGWEAVSVSTHNRGWLWWRREVRTWLFQKRIPCQLKGSFDRPGTVTSRLIPAQEIPRIYDNPEDGYP